MSRLPIWVRGTIVTLSSTVVGVVLLYVAADVKNKDWQSILQQVGAIVLTAGALSWWGAYNARMEVTRALATIVPRAEIVRRAGICGVGSWPIPINEKATEMVMVMIRGATVLASLEAKLRRMLTARKCELTVYLVDPGREAMVHGLAGTFGESVGECKTKMVGSVTTLVRLGQSIGAGKGKSRVRVFFHQRMPAYTYYRFGGERFVVWYAFEGGHVDVPYLRLEEGELSRFFDEDLERLSGDPATRMCYDSAKGFETVEEHLRHFGVPAERIEAVREGRP